MSEWIEWKGGECPVDEDTMIEVQVVMLGDVEPRTLFPRMAWANAWADPRLVAYRIVDGES